MLTQARILDETDPLAQYREAFVFADPGILYLDGNSLGRLPKATAERMRQVVDEEWGSRLVRGWGEGWLDLPNRVGAKLATLVGAKPTEVLACDSTSVNFYKLAFAALSARPDRRRIVTDRANFPSDLYLLQGLRQSFPNLELTILDDVSGPDGEKRIEDALGEDVAFLTLSHVAYWSGELYELNRLAELAHKKGAWTLWDLSHSVGAVPIELNNWQADLAVGCTYKYLNGGPGATAFLYVRDDIQELLTSPVWGWFGQRNAFDMEGTYDPANGIQRFMAGTPPILSLSAIEPGLDLANAAGIQNIREKSVAMSERFIALADIHLASYGFEVASPRESSCRGSHVILTHSDAWRINRALIEEANLIPDFRAPNGLRLGFAPLYNSFQDVDDAVGRIVDIVHRERHLSYSRERTAVT